VKQITLAPAGFADEYWAMKYCAMNWWAPADLC